MLYWDLRYFNDMRIYRRTGGNDLPMPNTVAVNGPATLVMYLQAGYPKENLVEVEALRYLHLSETKVRADSVSSSRYEPENETLRLLVLGDYFLSNTRQQMKMLMQATQSLPVDMAIMVKPHPNCPIYSTDYPGLIMTVTMEPISKLLAECDVSYTSAISSAAVDAYCSGVPVVSVLAMNTLNLSPLRGCPGVLYVSTPEDLATALVSAAMSPRTIDVKHKFFTLDPELPRWLKLIMGSLT